MTVPNPDAKQVCDGCNVREPHEHRCHGAHAITVQGETRHGGCECAECEAEREGRWQRYVAGASVSEQEGRA